MNILKSNKVRVSLVGGAVIIATAYGTCTVDPDESAIEEKIEQVIEQPENNNKDADAEKKSEEKEGEEKPKPEAEEKEAESK